jgi:signal transduction histidine kinase
VAAHHTTLVQTVVNLLNNAIMFVAPGVHPRIRVWAERRAEDDRMYVRLWLEDNGIGIAPHHQQRIFQVFERLHSQDAYPGTGIGLAIVRRGLERMGGRVGVESAEGQGSRFWIELPAAEDS